MDDCIRRAKAIKEMMDEDVDHAQGKSGREVIQILMDMAPAQPEHECETCRYNSKEWNEEPCDSCTMGGSTNHWKPQMKGGTGMRMIDVDAFKADYRMADECKDCEMNVRACEYDRSYTKMDFCGWLDDAPTVPQWIPCSERQPTEDGEYITTVEDGEGMFVTSNDWRQDWQEWGFWSVDEEYNEVWRRVTNVVAWMPLPEPHKNKEGQG